LLLHIGAFRLDIDSKRQTFWHELAPQTRILCVLLLLFAIVLTPNGQWQTWGIYGTGILLALLVSQVTFTVLLKRLAVEMSFVSVVLIGTLFRGGGEVVWQWGWLQISTNGLTVLGSVFLKSSLSLLLLNLLTLTTSVPALLNGLIILKVPQLLVAVLASMYRYLGVLIDEFTAMRRAALSRNLMAKKRWQRLIIGNTIGSLFIRTYERGDRIHQAMLSRGYRGLPPAANLPQGRRRDVVALSLVGLFAIFGQAIALIGTLI
jgi:cobalt/nickel transport system permease protein